MCEYHLDPSALKPGNFDRFVKFLEIQQDRGMGALSNLYLEISSVEADHPWHVHEASEDVRCQVFLEPRQILSEPAIEETRHNTEQKIEVDPYHNR